MARKKKYLNNSDMLKQIHLSKMSYCMFLDPINDNQQDMILDHLDEIQGTQNIQVSKDEEGEPIMEDVSVITIARQLRAKRLNKLNDTKLTMDDIDITDVVFRIMTSEHIPLVPKKKAKKKTKKKQIITELFDEFDDNVLSVDNVITDEVEMVPLRCKFPPFFHYRVNDNLEPSVVGKSHWKGEKLDEGEFGMEHGQVTNELAIMYMKLCERYATRSNWRGYTYNDEMRGQALLQLAQVGLQFNEHKSANPFSYFTAIVTNSFTRVLNIEKKMQNIRDDILEDNNLTPSWTRQFANEQTHQKYLNNPNKPDD